MSLLIKEIIVGLKRTADLPKCWISCLYSKLYVVWNLKWLRNLIWELLRQSWNKKTVLETVISWFPSWIFGAVEVGRDHWDHWAQPWIWWQIYGEFVLWDWQKKSLGLLIHIRNNCIRCIKLFKFGIKKKKKEKEGAFFFFSVFLVIIDPSKPLE